MDDDAKKEEADVKASSPVKEKSVPADSQPNELQVVEAKDSHKPEPEVSEPKADSEAVEEKAVE